MYSFLIVLFITCKSLVHHAFDRFAQTFGIVEVYGEDGELGGVVIHGMGRYVCPQMKQI
jgi:hypothetical protein